MFFGTPAFQKTKNKTNRLRKNIRKKVRKIFEIFFFRKFFFIRKILKILKIFFDEKYLKDFQIFPYKIFFFRKKIFFENLSNFFSNIFSQPIFLFLVFWKARVPKNKFYGFYEFILKFGTRVNLLN